MEMPQVSYGTDSAPLSLADVLSDELVGTTDFMLLYVTEDGHYLSLCMGNQTLKFNTQYSVTHNWKDFKLAATDESLKYKCMHCTYGTNYLYNMMNHHKKSHPEFSHLKNDERWISHYSKYTGKQPARDAEKRAAIVAENDVSGKEQYAMNKYKCPHCNYKSMYHQNLNDHMAAEHGHFTDSGETNTQPESLENGESQPSTSELQGLSHSGSDDDQLYKEEDLEDHDLPHAEPPTRHHAELATGHHTEPHTGHHAEPHTEHPAEPNTVATQGEHHNSQTKMGAKSAVTCEFCNQQFEHKRLKDIHVASYHRVGDCYQCPYCKQNVLCQEWPEHLKKHSVPTGTAYCELCGKKFKSMRNLKNHRLEVHEEGKIHSCPEPGCSSVFARARNLRSHLSLHQGSKQHMCDICGEGYALKSSLGKHRKTKHPEELAMRAPNNLDNLANYAPPLPQPPQANMNDAAGISPQVKGKVLVTPRPDGSVVLSSKPGDAVDFTQQGAVLVLPQSAPDNTASQVEGTVVVMQQSNGSTFNAPQPVAAASASPQDRVVTKRRSYWDLSGKKIRRQSSMDLGGENQIKFEVAPVDAPPEHLQPPPALPRCRYCKDLYFTTKEQLKSHILDVHKVTSSQDAADLEASKNCKPEVKLVSQFSNTPHTQLSQDLIEAAYLLSLQHEQQQQLQDGTYTSPPLSDVNIE